MKTANNAASLATTGSPLLDFFGKAGAMRKQTAEQQVALFRAAYEESPEHAIRCLFYIRDVRGGQGERLVFRNIMSFLVKDKPQLVISNLPLIANFGRWDDVASLLDTDIGVTVAGFLMERLRADIAAAQSKGAVSLLAKWMPSENASSANTVRLARKFMSLAKIGPKLYRNLLSGLRRHIKIVETDLCNKECANIDYAKVPSQASSRYKKAFLRNDGERYRAFIADVLLGKKKMNAGAIYPYQIIAPLFSGGMERYHEGKLSVGVRAENKEIEDAIEAQWRNLPNYFDKPQNALAIVDTSGSMRGLPIQVAISLGLYFASKNKGVFANSFITFSKQPELQFVEGETVAEKVRSMVRVDWNSNTDIQAVFNLLLDVSVTKGVTADEMPEKLFLISDMQFDMVDPANKTTNLEAIREKYAAAGLKMPELVFWNVNSRSDFPVSKDDRGIMYVSGCSPTVLRHALNGEITTPEKKMLDVLMQARYDGLVF